MDPSMIQDPLLPACTAEWLELKLKSFLRRQGRLNISEGEGFGKGRGKDRFVCEFSS